MPKFDITISGKTYHVEVPDPGASPLQVIVDGETFDVAIAGSQSSPAPAQLAEAPRPAPQPAPLRAPSAAPVARPAAPGGANGAANGGSLIAAPMPGTILTVDVKVGQAVEPGQVVCVLEAMKMKNPIRANVAGAVAEVVAQPGQTVAYGDLLVRLA